MKRFEFRLEPVRRLKSQLLEVEETRLSKLLRTEHDLQARLHRVHEELRDQARFLLESGSLPGHVLAGYAAFQSNSRRLGDSLTGEIADCRRAQAEQRARILELHVELELIEKLRDRRRQEWTRLLHKETDEMASEAFLSRLVRQAAEPRQQS